MKNLIAISGKIKSGKDTVGEMIQQLTMSHVEIRIGNTIYKPTPTFEIKRFADALKQIIVVLTGCKREDLENGDFKNSILPEIYNLYHRIERTHEHYRKPILVSKKIYDETSEVLYQKSGRRYTYREALTFIGTDLLRDKFHPDVWVNSLFKDYKESFNEYSHLTGTESKEGFTTYPSWIITDCRFLNEALRIKDHNGILIRVERDIQLRFPEWFIDEEVDLGQYDEVLNHASETGLDDYKEFTHIIHNNGTLDDLKANVKALLIMEGILPPVDNGDAGTTTITPLNSTDLGTTIWNVSSTKPNS